jgi:hypothetical protein
MKLNRGILILASALFITIPLVYLAFSPINLIHVQVRPVQNYGTRILSTDILMRSATTTVVYFDFKALVDSSSISKIRLSIRPSAESEWYEQEYVVAQGLAMGVAQLGSEKFPVKQREQYTFRLTSTDGSMLSDGQIQAEVDHIAGSENWIIGGIGILASVLQIIYAILETRRKPSW